MANTEQFNDELKKALDEVSNDLEKAVKDKTNAKIAEHESKETDEEEEEEDDEDDEEADIEKAMGFIKKAKFGTEYEESTVAKALKKEGYSESVIKKTLSNMNKAKIKKALSGNDELRQEMADVTDFIEGLNNAQDRIEKSLYSVNETNSKLIKSLAVLSKGMIYIMDSVDKIAAQPIVKGITNTKAIERKFDNTVVDNKVLDVKTVEGRTEIRKAIASIAFKGDLNAGSGVKVLDRRAAEIHKSLGMPTFENATELTFYTNEIEQKTGKKLKF